MQDDDLTRTAVIKRGPPWRLLAAILLALPLAAWADVFDRVDVKRSGDEVEITIRFTGQVAYQRHSPPARGDSVRVYLQMPGVDPAATPREEKASAPSELLGAVVATYPDAMGALSVKLPEVTAFRVRQGADGRSISLFVPAPAVAPAAVPHAAVEGAAAAAVVGAAAAAPGAATGAATAAPGAATVTPVTAAAIDTVKATTSGAVPAAPAAAGGSESAAPTQAPAAAPAAAAPEGAAAAPVPTSAEVEARAKLYLTQAQNALEQNQPAPAIEALNNLLALPPNSLSQQGQETIGVARERAGEFAKAKAEYELYLTLYPKGEGADRVREHLAKLPAIPAAESAAVATRRSGEETGWRLYGGLSQYRYHGESTTTTEPLRVCLVAGPGCQTPAQIAAANANTNTVSRSVQNTLVTNVDATEERRTSSTDDKLVVRDVLDTNYQANSSQGQARNQNRLTTAYYERSDRDLAYMFRVGRQSGIGGGVLGEYNGLSASYNSSPQLRWNVQAGSVYEYGSPYKKQVFGGSADLQPSQARQFGGSAYFVEQRFDGKADRAAVGGEARYFDATKSAFATLDYDVLFRALNIAMLQVNLQGASGANYYVNVDHRRSPVLMLSSALDGTLGVTLQQLLDQVGEKEVREDIKRMTPFSNSFGFGLTTPLSPQWQIGGDYHVSNLSSTKDTVSLPPPTGALAGTPYRAGQPGSGNTHSVSFQGIGNNLLQKNDLFVANLGFFLARNTAAPYTASSLTFNYVMIPSDKWRYDGSMRFYVQRNDPNSFEPLHTTQTRISPSLRASYRLRNNLNFEIEGNIEYDRNSDTSASGQSRSTVKFIYAGYRWDWL